MNPPLLRNTALYGAFGGNFLSSEPAAAEVLVPLIHISSLEDPPASEVDSLFLFFPSAGIFLSTKKTHRPCAKYLSASGRRGTATSWGSSLYMSSRAMSCLSGVHRSSLAINSTSFESLFRCSAVGGGGGCISLGLGGRTSGALGPAVATILFAPLKPVAPALAALKPPNANVVAPKEVEAPTSSIVFAPKVGRAPAPNAGAAAADPPSGDGAVPMGLRAPPAGAAPKLPDVAGAGKGWHGAVLPVPAAAAPPKTCAELSDAESRISELSDSCSSSETS